jgi:hypothetical protein
MHFEYKYRQLQLEFTKRKFCLRTTTGKHCSEALGAYHITDNGSPHPSGWHYNILASGLTDDDIELMYETLMQTGRLLVTVNFADPYFNKAKWSLEALRLHEIIHGGGVEREHKACRVG